MTRPGRLCCLLILCAAASAALSCSREPPPAIELRGPEIIVQNQTTVAWTGLEVWVNDFYRGLAPSLGAGQRLVVPLDNLVESYGRRFDVHRSAVVGVLVLARGADGKPVRITWGRVRR